MSRKNNVNNKSTTSKKNQYSDLLRQEQRVLASIRNVQKPRSASGPRIKRKGGQQPQKSVAAAYASGQIGRSPVITQTKDSCRVRNRELISSVAGSSAFTVQNTFPLQPGMATTFPWLSTMAQCWEEYEFHALKFEYFTRTGSNVPGSMMLTPDYDASDPAPVSEQVASSYMGSAEDAPWKDIVCILPKKDLSAQIRNRFTRMGPLAANLDIKTYDAGNLFVCSVDGTAVNWGKLWVEYDVEFRIPQLPSQGASLPTGGGVTGNATTGANPLGLVPIVDPQATGFTVNNGSVITFQNPGDYEISLLLIGTAISAMGMTFGAGASILAALGPTILVSGLQAQDTEIVRISTIGATVTLTATATTLTTERLSIAIGPTNSFS